MSKHTLEELLLHADANTPDHDEDSFDPEDSELLSDLRLLQLLISKSHVQAPGDGNLDTDTLLKYIDEEIPHDQRADLEKALKSNPDAFDAYLSAKMDKIASRLPDVPVEASNSALAAFLAPIDAAENTEIHPELSLDSSTKTNPTSPKEKSSGWGGKLRDLLHEIFSPAHPNWAAGIAFSGFIAFFGLSLIQNPQGIDPMLVNDLSFDYRAESTALVFRGSAGQESKLKVTIIDSGEFNLTNQLRNMLSDFTKSPNEDDLDELFLRLSITSKAASKPDYIQIEPEFMTKVQKFGGQVVAGNWVLLSVSPDKLGLEHVIKEQKDKYVLLYFEHK